MGNIFKIFVCGVVAENLGTPYPSGRLRPSSYLWINSVLAIAAAWRENQRIEDISISFFVLVFPIKINL